MKEQIIKKLEKLNSCSEAVEFARKHATSQEAWDACERGDWMLWLLGKLSGKPESKSRKKLVLTACKCARLSLKYLPKDEKRPLKAIQTAENWAQNKGGVTIQEVETAAYAAYAAAAYAANAAAYAAANAAYAAASAAAYAANAANAAETLKECAKIVRKYYPKAPRLKG